MTRRSHRRARASRSVSPATAAAVVAAALRPTERSGCFTATRDLPRVSARAGDAVLIHADGAVTVVRPGAAARPTATVVRRTTLEALACAVDVTRPEETSA